MEDSHTKYAPPFCSEVEQTLLTGPDLAALQAEPTFNPDSPSLPSPSSSEVLSTSATSVHADARTADIAVQCQPGVESKHRRKRLSAADHQRIRDEVTLAYRNGHPPLAIMLRLGLREEQLTKILAELLMAGVLTPTDRNYEVLPVSKAIKNIPGLEIGTEGYVRVMKTDSGILLTPYTPEGGKHEQG